MKPLDVAQSAIDEQSALQLMQRLIKNMSSSPAAASLQNIFITRAVADALGKGQQYLVQTVLECGGDPETLWKSLKSHSSFSSRTFDKILNVLSLATSDDCLASKTGPISKQGLIHWQEHGYVVVKGIIPRDTSLAIAESLMRAHGTSMDDRSTWRQAAGGPFFRNQFNIPELNIARQSEIAREAFQQVWQCDNLIISRDTYSLNFPETSDMRYQGIGLHLDVDFRLPLHFKTQGIVYLNDVAEDQGALTLCQGFHHQFEHWLASQPKDSNPNDCNFYQYPHQPVAAEAGDLIIWHHWLPHSSSPNLNSDPRIAQYLDMYSLTPRYVSSGQVF